MSRSDRNKNYKPFDKYCISIYLCCECEGKDTRDDGDGKKDERAF